MGKRLESKNKNWLIFLIAMVVIVAFVAMYISFNVKGNDMNYSDLEKEIKGEKENSEITINELQIKVDVLEMEKQELNKQIERLSQKDTDIVTDNGWLSVKNGKIVNKNNEVIQLKGVSSHGINWFPEYTNHGAMETMRDYGANVFRVAMYTQAENGYNESKDMNIKLMRMAIENAIYADMYVVVDWHILDDADPNIYTNQAAEFFDMISKYYSDCPNVLYEICNEPNGDTSWQDITNYANTIIPIIRNNSPDSLIMVGTPSYSSDISDAMKKPLNYENIMYSYHVYTKYYKQSGFDELKQAIELKFPVIVSEWGIGYENDDLDENIQVADRFLDILDSNDISWVFWCFSNKDEEYSIIDKNSTKYSGFTDKDFTKTGKYIVEKLSK